MSTPYESVNDMFLSKVTDDLYISITEEETKADLLMMMRSALVLFKYPKVNVMDRDDTLKQFNVKLGDDEMVIIAEIMKHEWLKRQMHDVRLTKPTYTDKDFKMTSQAYHLAKLTDLVKQQRDILHNLQVLYTTRNKETRQADFSRLAGDNRR